VPAAHAPDANVAQRKTIIGAGPAGGAEHAGRNEVDRAHRQRANAKKAAAGDWGMVGHFHGIPSNAA